MSEARIFVHKLVAILEKLPPLESQSLLTFTELPKRAAIEIRRQFGIGHSTIQLETDDGSIVCELAPDHVP